MSNTKQILKTIDGENLAVGPSKRKLFVIAVIAIVIILFFAFVVLLAHPIISRFYLTPKEYVGIEFYDDDLYRNFENGEHFVRSFNSYSFADQCEVTGFYYVDNKVRDNLIYGKMPDVYSIDLDIGLDYHEIHNYIMTNGIYCDALQNYDFYLMPYESNEQNCFFFVIDNCINSNVKYIFITDTAESDYVGETVRFSIVSTLLSTSALEWMQ